MVIQETAFFLITTNSLALTEKKYNSIRNLSKLRLNLNIKRKTVNEQDVERVISLMAQIPEKSVSTKDRVSLGKLEEDLKRRDFTINSIAKDVNGSLIDPYGGLEDIKNKIFRQTSQSFSEDPLRSIRYAKFKTYPHLADFSLEKTTEESIKNIGKSDELHQLSADRIWMELKTALTSSKSSNFFSTIISLGIAEPWFSKIHSFDIDEDNSPELKWVELEIQNNFLLNEYLELPKEFLELTNLSFQLTNFDIEEDEEGLIEKLEKINFHRNHKKVDEIIKLKFFKNKRDYLIKLKDNILSKDFSVLGEAPKKDMMKMKKNLYIESIKESK